MRYDKEFKEQAMKLSDEVGVKKAAEQLGIKYHTLTDWRKIRKNKKERIQLSNNTDAQTRIRQLEKEISELKQTNDAFGKIKSFNVITRKEEIIGSWNENRNIAVVPLLACECKL